MGHVVGVNPRDIVITSITGSTRRLAVAHTANVGQFVLVEMSINQVFAEACMHRREHTAHSSNHDPNKYHHHHHHSLMLCLLSSTCFLFTAQ